MKIKHIIILVAIAVVALAFYLNRAPGSVITDLVSTKHTFSTAVVEFEGTLDAIDRQITNDGLASDVALTAEQDVVTALTDINTAVSQINSTSDTATDFPTFLSDLETFYEALADYKTTFSFIEQSIADSGQASDLSMTATLSETLTLLSEIAASPQQYFQENVPQDFDPSQAEDEGERQSGA